MLSIKSTNSETLMRNAAEFLWQKLSSSLKSGKKILLLLSGGSAIEVYKNLSGRMEEQENGFAKKLTVGLVDERYGKPGHPDSNEKQIRDTGFYESVEENGGKVLSVLTGKNHLQEADRYNGLIRQNIKEADQFWAVLGIGPDGHTAGILPQDSEKTLKQTFPDDRLIVYYKLSKENPNPFKKRITLTPHGLKQIDLAVVVAKSQGKEAALKRMFSPSESIYKTPAALLPGIDGVLFTDQKIT